MCELKLWVEQFLHEQSHCIVQIALEEIVSALGKLRDMEYVYEGSIKIPQSRWWGKKTSAEAGAEKSAGK